MLSEIGQRFGAFMGGPAEPETYADSVGRSNRQLLWLDGFVSNLSESFTLNFTNPFAMALGATNAQIGLLSSFTNLASALGLMPGARLAERLGHRKLLTALTGGLIGRLLLFVLAALPLFLGAPAITLAVVSIIGLRAFVNQLGFPAWSALVGDLVPPTIRGRYFASRNVGLAIAALTFTPLAGRIVESVGGVQGYQVGFVLAGATGLAATAIFMRIKEPLRSPSARLQLTAPAPLRQLLQGHQRFLAYMVVALVWNLALMIAGPFFSVYLVRSLGATPTQIGILAAVNSVGNIAGQRVFGRLNDRRGSAWVTGTTGLLIPAVPLGWALAPGTWWLVPIEVFSGFMWAGYGLAGFNLLLALSPESQRERFVALYQTVVFGAAFVGPLLGSVIADAVSVKPLLWISCFGRLAAALLFLFTVRLEHEQAP